MEFDKEFDKLKKISQELEGDSITLDESVAKYTEACKIIESCVGELAKVKGNVTVLRNKIEDMIEENLE